MNRLIEKTPAAWLVVLAIIGVQLGSVIATGLFAEIGAPGVVAARIVISALLLMLLVRSRLSTFGTIFREHWMVLVTFGLCIAVLNFFFYQAIARIPVGAAVALEFAGPLGLAAMTSRRLSQFAWVALAGLGIVLLSPLSGADLNPTGVIFALMAGVAWALFILLAGVVGRRLPEHDGLVIAMMVAAIVMLPLITPVVGKIVVDVKLLLGVFGIAILSTAIPFVFEFAALRRLSARVYGVLVSLEPAVAVLAGAVLLHENIGLRGFIAVTCIVVAALGITLTNRESA